MDTIFIHDLRVETRVGVYAWERELAQTLRIDVELALASKRPFETGELADAIDYAKVVAHVKAFASDHPHLLLERFAEVAEDGPAAGGGALQLQGGHGVVLVEDGD